MTVLIVLLGWLLVLPLAGLLCGRLLGFGNRPSSPRQSAGLDASGRAPESARAVQASTVS